MEGQQSPAQSQGGPGSRCDSGWSPQVVSSLDPQALLGGHLELQTLPWGWDQQCSSGSPLPGSVFTVSCLYLTVALARTALCLHACACARVRIPSEIQIPQGGDSIQGAMGSQMCPTLLRDVPTFLLRTLSTPGSSPSPLFPGVPVRHSEGSLSFDTGSHVPQAGPKLTT